VPPLCFLISYSLRRSTSTWSPADSLRILLRGHTLRPHLPTACVLSALGSSTPSPTPCARPILRWQLFESSSFHSAPASLNGSPSYQLQAPCRIGPLLCQARRHLHLVASVCQIGAISESGHRFTTFQPKPTSPVVAAVVTPPKSGPTIHLPSIHSSIAPSFGSVLGAKSCRPLCILCYSCISAIHYLISITCLVSIVGEMKCSDRYLNYAKI
jgi:hypothetical protein